MSERWMDNWEMCEREIESWLDDDQLLAELGRRCALSMLGCHPDLDRADRTVQLLLRQLLAADWLGSASALDDEVSVASEAKAENVKNPIV